MKKGVRPITEEQAGKPKTNSVAQPQASEKKGNEFQQRRRRRTSKQQPAHENIQGDNSASATLTKTPEKTAEPQVTQLTLTSTTITKTTVDSSQEVIPEIQFSQELDNEFKKLAAEIGFDPKETPAAATVVVEETPEDIAEETNDQENTSTLQEEQDTEAQEEVKPANPSNASNPGFLSRMSTNILVASRYVLNLVMLKPVYETNQKTVDTYAQVPKAMLNGLKATVNKFTPASKAVTTLPSCCRDSANEGEHTPESKVLTFTAPAKEVVTGTQTVAPTENKSANNVAPALKS